MTQGYEIDAPRLRAHATTVESIAQDLHASGATSIQPLQGNAFGMLCAFAPLMMAGPNAQVAALVADLGATVSATATAARSMAANYENSEHDTTFEMRRLDAGQESLSQMRLR